MNKPTVAVDWEVDTTPPKTTEEIEGPVSKALTSLVAGAILIGVVYVIIVVLFSLAKTSTHPAVKTPVRMSTYLAAIGFNADAPTVSIGSPVLVPAGEVTGSSGSVLGTGSGSVQGTFKPGLYYPVKITIGTKTTTIVLNGDRQLVADSSVARPSLQFKTDPALTQANTTTYNCWSWNLLSECTTTKRPALVQSKLAELRNGAAAQLIEENIGTLTLPPGMMPKN